MSPLWLLIGLNLRAAVRRVVRQARTPKGVVLTLVGVAAVVLWIGRQVWAYQQLPPADPADVRAAAPVALLGLCLFNVLTSAGERAVSFSPGEVAFLFPGPFSRRQLLAYKLARTGLTGVASAMVFAVVLGHYGGSYAGRVVAVWLMFQFVQLASMTAALVQATAGERATGRWRWWAGGAALAVAAAAATPIVVRHRADPAPDVAAQLRRSAVGRVVLAPFVPFAEGLSAVRLAGGLGWDAVAAAEVAALVATVFSLDANYLEAAATASGKRYARLARVRQSGLAGTASPASVQLRLPMLPWLGGAGPTAWRQLTGVVRTSRVMLVVLGVLAVVVGGAVARATGRGESVRMLALVGVSASLFLTSLLRFDFRGDLDHMDVLRSMPARPGAVAAAQVVAPTVVLSAVQGLLLAAAATVGHLPGAWAWASWAFAVPANAVLVASENLLFLWMPSRPSTAVAGDMSMAGRRTLSLMAQLVMVLAVGGVGAVFAVAGYTLAGRSLAAAVAAAWVPAVAVLAGMVALMADAFDKFDSTTDVPP